MWIGLTAIIVVTIVLVLLAVRWRVICAWNSGLLEVRVRFMGLSRTVWKVDVFEHTSRHGDADPAKEPFDRFGEVLGRIVDRFEALFEHREVIVNAGRAGARLARRFRHWWQLDHGTIELSFGLKNPAHTGMTHGALSAISGMVGARWPQVRVLSNPDFDKPSFDSRGELVFSIRAWDPVKDLIRFAATLPWQGLLRLKRILVYE